MTKRDTANGQRAFLADVEPRPLSIQDSGSRIRTCDLRIMGLNSPNSIS
ncbi:MAG: hypothetical protein ACYSWZ_01370 [Planctomycetota bacterium]